MVNLPSGDLHLIDVERRASSEKFSLFLLQVLPGDLQQTTGALLAATASVDGVWTRAVPKLPMFRALQPLRWSAVRHPIVDGRIDPDRLLRTLHRFLNPSRGVPTDG
jgi:hypothetical protein